MPLGNWAQFPCCERHGSTTRTKEETSFNGLKKVSFTAARMLSRCRGALASVARLLARSSGPSIHPGLLSLKTVRLGRAPVGVVPAGSHSAASRRIPNSAIQIRASVPV